MLICTKNFKNNLSIQNELDFYHETVYIGIIMIVFYQKRCISYIKKNYIFRVLYIKSF